MSFDLETTFPTLRNAPITEAIIDLQANLPPDVSLAQLLEFQNGVEQRFTEVSERRALQARVEFQKNSLPRVIPPSSAPDGYLFRSPSENLIVQARLDGFTLSRLHPYHDGDTFAEQAADLWRRYVRIARPIEVTRLAVRNVNRIDVLPGVDLQRYLLTAPQISRGLPQLMAGFFLQIVLPDVSGAVAIVNETFGNWEPGSRTIPVILDIDASRTIQLEPNGAEIWEIIAQLRKLKNRIFFKSLTTEALEAYR
jgi:uncharacterized protein (TIGR04255 family)